MQIATSDSGLVSERLSSLRLMTEGGWRCGDLRLVRDEAGDRDFQRERVDGLSDSY
jgi:hypothetical protein